jgi:uncharacterized membrane protein YkoI
MQINPFAAIAVVVTGTSLVLADVSSMPIRSGSAHVPDPAPAILLAQAPTGQDQAAEIARNAIGGKVLGVRAGADAGEQKVYEVKVLSADGRVVVVRVDGRTGAILH